MDIYHRQLPPRAFLFLDAIARVPIFLCFHSLRFVHWQLWLTIGKRRAKFRTLTYSALFFEFVCGVAFV